MNSLAPRLWIYTDAARRQALAAAVTAGGGVSVADIADAEAIVWAADEPERLGGALHPGIRWVQLSSAGIEDWFEAGVIDNRRTWTAAKGVYAEPIAEYVLAMLLAGARRLPELLAQRRWQPLAPLMLRQATVGLIGAGQIGEAILRLLAPFSPHTIALTRSGRPVPGADRSVGPDALDDVLRESDYLVLAAPQTPATRQLLDADRIATIKQGAFIVNVGRGTLIDTDALERALRTGHLAGAALDVTDPEPLPPHHPLWTHPTTIITSHTASTLALGWPRFLTRVAENVSRFGSGRDLLGGVDVLAQY